MLRLEEAKVGQGGSTGAPRAGARCARCALNMTDSAHHGNQWLPLPASDYWSFLEAAEGELSKDCSRMTAEENPANLACAVRGGLRAHGAHLPAHAG